MDGQAQRHQRRILVASPMKRTVGMCCSSLARCLIQRSSSRCPRVEAEHHQAHLRLGPEVTAEPRRRRPPQSAATAAWPTPSHLNATRLAAYASEARFHDLALRGQDEAVGLDLATNRAGFVAQSAQSSPLA